MVEVAFFFMTRSADARKCLDRLRKEPSAEFVMRRIIYAKLRQKTASGKDTLKRSGFE